MATFLKNAGESAGTGVESGVLPSRADHLSADAVSLEVPVKVHGSRVIEGVPGSVPHTEPFEEQTTTMIVFPQGGVIRMSTLVSVGQMLVLTNLKTKQDAICRVVKVRTYSNLAGYVEIEFTSMVPGYWGVNFAPDGLDLPKKDAPAAPANSSLASSGAKASSPVVSLDPIAGIDTPAKSPKASGSSASVSPKHDTVAHVSGSKIGIVRPESPLPNASASEKASRADFAVVATKEAKVSEVSKAAADPADWHAQDLTEGLNGPPESYSADAARAVSRPAFGASLEKSDSSTESVKPWQDWRVIAAGLGLVVLLGSGGYFLGRARTAGSSAVEVKPAAAPAPAPVVAAVATPAVVAPPPAVPAKASKVVPAPLATPSATPSNTAAQAAKAVSPAVSEDRPESATATRPTKSARDVTSDLFGSLNAHPVAGRRDIAAVTPEVVPSIEAAPVVPGVGAAPAIPGPSSASTIPNLRERTGNAQVQSPRVVRSEPPAYPLAAKQFRTEGDVIVDVTVDRNGKVSDAKAVAGPQILREAAIDSVRHWTYAPAILDGQPVQATFTVTLKFRL